MPLRVAPLDGSYRADLRALLERTASFTDAEVGVALELFDETFATGAPCASQTDPHFAPASTTYRFLGAFDRDGDLAGYVCYGPTPGTDRTFDLYWIAVHPAAQGTGSGTLLLSEVERRLTDDDARMLVVETSSRSGYDATRRFYARRGYVEAARTRDFYAPADDRIMYVKRFHGRPARGAGVQAK